MTVRRKIAIYMTVCSIEQVANLFYQQLPRFDKSRFNANIHVRSVSARISQSYGCRKQAEKYRKRLCALSVSAVNFSSTLKGETIHVRMEEKPEQTLYRLLTQRPLWLAVAESSTGGLVGHRITSVPGSSAYFRGGVIAYDNAVKETLLGVPRQLIEQYGAVSAEVALEMARSVRHKLNADLGLSVTGIAGPTGATPTKPVGLAYVAIVAPGLERVEGCLNQGDRAANNSAFADLALRLAIEYLEGR